MPKIPFVKFEEGIFATLIPIKGEILKGHKILIKGCNMSCYYCDRITLKKKGLIWTEDVKQYINSLPEDSIVSFTGGEPTLYPEQIKKLMIYAQNKGLYVIFSSNGKLSSIVEEFSQIANSAKLDIKGTEDQYQAIFKSENSYSNLEKSIFSVAKNCKTVELKIIIHYFTTSENLITILSFLEDLIRREWHPKIIIDFQYVKDFLGIGFPVKEHTDKIAFLNQVIQSVRTNFLFVTKHYQGKKEYVHLYSLEKKSFLPLYDGKISPTFD